MTTHQKIFTEELYLAGTLLTPGSGSGSSYDPYYKVETVANGQMVFNLPSVANILTENKIGIIVKKNANSGSNLVIYNVDGTTQMAKMYDQHAQHATFVPQGDGSTWHLI